MENTMKAKERNLILYAVIGIGLLWFFGFIQIPGFPSPYQLGTVQPGGGGTPGTQPVNKPVRFMVFDKYGGSALSSQTISVYDSNMVLVDTLTTDSNGQDDTNAAHKTGEKLHCELVGSTGERKWVDVTVPGQSPAEAQSLTTNPVTLDFYDYTAPLLKVVCQNGTVLTDTGVYNHTATGNTLIATVSWYQPTDGDGCMASYDPIYGLQQNALLVVKIHETEYDEVAVTGLLGGYETASARYFYATIDPTTLSKWKVGNEYRYPGVGSITCSFGLSSISGTSVDIDFYVYYFADWSYFLQHGNFGPNALSVISGAPYTVNIDT